MASNLSGILKSELLNTIEQLLSKGVVIESFNKYDLSNIDNVQFVQVQTKFEFTSNVSKWSFFIPTSTATKFEYLMLGGMGDFKNHIDDEISDAVNEIISNICGSFCTTVNAQGFPDVGTIKSEVVDFAICEKEKLNFESELYVINLQLDEDKLLLYIAFDEVILPFLSVITGNETQTLEKDSVDNKLAEAQSNSIASPNVDMESVNLPKNLELLYDIKLKLSVRLGTKLLLLKDILNWDIGEIIELEQMVNEPLEILVNGVKIGEGEAVIVEGRFGLKIKRIASSNTRISQIGL